MYALRRNPLLNPDKAEFKVVAHFFDKENRGISDYWSVNAQYSFPTKEACAAIGIECPTDATSMAVYKIVGGENGIATIERVQTGSAFKFDFDKALRKIRMPLIIGLSVGGAGLLGLGVWYFFLRNKE